MIAAKYTMSAQAKGKKANKQHLCETFRLDPELPLFVFIGRLVGDKGADLLPEIIGRSLYENPGALNFLVLGSGDAHTEWMLQQTRQYAGENFNVYMVIMKHFPISCMPGQTFCSCLPVWNPVA